MADTQIISGLDDVLNKLKALPPEVVSKRGGPVKSALRKGGVVVQQAMRANIRAIVAEPNAEGFDYVSTGTLEKSVVVRRDPRPERTGANERYRVLVARRKYADGTPVIAAARWLEFGTERMQAKPWATPAYFEARQRALDTVVSELRNGIDRIVRKMSRSRR